MTPPGPDLTLRTLADDDWPDAVEIDSQAFGSTMDAEVTDAERAMHDGGRMIGAFDGAGLVGLTAAYAFELTVPGAVLPAAGVTWVAVLPTHRRRGVLRALMAHQLHEIHDESREPLAVLWASEPPIYGRFGYGLASRAFALKVPRGPSAVRADAPADHALQLRLVDPADWKVVADAYDEAARKRPGMMRRDERWHQRAARDLPSQRGGRSALRCVVAQDGERVRGYARYSTKPNWAPTGPNGTVDVREVIAVDPAALATLYRYLFDLDLMATTELWNVPADDPLLHWLADIRTTQPTWLDALYARLVDLPAALSRRTYSRPVDVVLQVEDRLCPWNDGRWRLTGDPAGGTCRATDDDADIALSVTEVGAAYLGGTSLLDLAAAGRVTELRAGAVAEASPAFSSSPQPWCPVIF